MEWGNTISVFKYLKDYQVENGVGLFKDVSEDRTKTMGLNYSEIDFS